MNDDRILFIDLETTGTDPNKHMITQIAAEYHVDGKKQDEFFVEVKALPQQGTAISLEALKVTNMTLKKVLSEGKDEGEALMLFVDWLLALNTNKMYICGHNVHFDIAFIKTLFLKYRIEQWDRVVSYRMEDTCSLARTMQKAGLLPEGTVKLGELANMFGINPPKGERLHNAATDVRVTAKVYYKLLKLLKTLGEDSGYLGK